METALVPTEETPITVPVEFRSDAEVLAWLKSQHTPLDVVETREGRGGVTFYYVRHQHITEMLNTLCRFDWDFEVMRERLDEDQVTVLGRLTIRVAGLVIVKSQYGEGEVERYGGGPNAGKPLSVGNAFKGAASDSLKKCASLLGIGLDLSLPIQPHTLRHLHAIGQKTFGAQWDEKRQKAVRTITGGKKTSANDLLDVEARALIAFLENDHKAEVVQAIAGKLRPR